MTTATTEYANENRAAEFLGAMVRDEVTGLTGFCTAYTQFLYGCNHVIIEPKVKKDDELPKAHSFDQQRMTIIKKPAALLKKAPKVGLPGGPAMEYERR